jgi:hypothetical protein
LRVVNHHLSKSLKGTVEDKLTIVSFASWPSQQLVFTSTNCPEAEPL